jgi:hypothetical protein
MVRSVVSKHLKKVFSEALRRSKACFHLAVGFLHKFAVKEVERTFVALVFHVCHIITQPPIYAFGTEFDVAIFGDEGFVSPFFVTTPGFDRRTQDKWRICVFIVELFGGEVRET